MSVERYYNSDGQLAVLVSHGYGAGWSTWNGYGIDLAIDKRIVEAKLRQTYKKNVKELTAFLDSIGYHNIYTGGWYDILIHWVDKGTKFRIDEYDGAEYIDILDAKDWCTA